MQINKEEIVDAVNSAGLKTVEEVGEATEAGTVCGSCQDDLLAIILSLK